MLGAFNRLYLSAVALPALVVAMAIPVSAEPVARNGAAAGAVIARKVGEEVRFIDVSNWQTVDLKQDLLSGDILRTNETGQLAILFSDRTQVRLGRNSSLVVKQVTSSTDADTVLQLQSGSIWARAERGGPGVKVETAAAAAAIRGTDWTMTVNGANTSLNVLEGVVQLSNPQGSVEVRQGEGAAATIGQAPRKVAIVDSDDREQMLFYLPPREAFERMPPSAQPVAKMRRDADRISAIQPERRSPEDWVTFAEAQLSLEGRRPVKQTLDTLQKMKLSVTQRARVTLIEAIIAGSETRYAEAAKLFSAAEPKLDRQRRGIALYGAYYARSLADPSKVENLPRQAGGPDGAFLRAYAIGFLKDLRAAMASLSEAEKQYPKDPGLPAYRAWLALLLNDRVQVQEAMEKALSLDPQEPTALEVRAYYKTGIQGDLKGALADIREVLKIAPGTSTAWNMMAAIQSDLGASREAEANYKHAIELDPEDPVAHTNLAVFYLEFYEVEKAKKEIDLALKLDPTLGPALIVRGMYYMQTGEMDKAMDDLLAGTVSNPSHSQGQLLLASNHYEKGDRLPAQQALDNADRLDRNDPVISAVRAAIAIDNYDSIGAIRNAQEYVKRSQARGGHYSSLGANQQAGSTLNDAFRFQDMNSWAEYYSDAVFDPFAGTAYIDQSIRGSIDIFANSYIYGEDIFNNTSGGQSFSAFLQGLMLEPHVISGRSRSANLLRRPFIEGSIGGGITAAGGEVGYTGEADIQGFSNLPFPISFYGNIQWQKVPDSRDTLGLTDMNSENRIIGGNGYLTASPTPYDRTVFYINDSNSRVNFDVKSLDFLPAIGVLPVTLEQSQSGRSVDVGLGWSHTVGYRDVVNAALLFNETNSRTSFNRTTDFFFGIPLAVDSGRSQFKQTSYVAALNHTVGSDDMTWRYGIEGGLQTSSQYQWFQDDTVVPSTIVENSSSTRAGLGRIYVDLLHEITADLKAEYALFGNLIAGNGADAQRLDPRLGIAWSPVTGQWLRAGFMRNSIDFSTPTLSPISVVGLQPNRISIDTDGRLDTLALRWDAEWTPDFFTAVEFQHQDVRDALISVPLTSAPFTTEKGRVDRGSLSTNLLLGYGFGLSSTVAYTDSKDEGPASAAFGGPLPYIPEWAGQVALTWVNEANIKSTIAANYVGNRVNETGVKLDDYWSLDASLTWEPLDKRFELDLAAYNLLDEDIELNTGISGWGRSFKGTLKVRF
ncbi:FecR domain-containing protein [Rhizobium sp. XQZ8]|uniref:FecR domain-containing protein n=1 Tax=Rhizobium populisoli TaxID=2859785 RepID=UPI001CA515D8|nr:FecR domain-containing protein [Rhizobium populisoli]MBW6424779.1 FecR domain-containing protein [Rhizobium populisoli]